MMTLYEWIEGAQPEGVFGHPDSDGRGWFRPVEPPDDIRTVLMWVPPENRDHIKQFHSGREVTE